MDTIVVNGATYYLPENEDDVISLVNQAKTSGKIICMRGAAHSFPIITTLEQESAENKNLYVMLSKMAAAAIDINKMQVVVQAGCHLGIDPFDPTGISTVENSLLWQLDQQGLALPDLGGITHQTVGGFISTGSSGGSTQYSFDDQLLSVSIINCGSNGAIKTTFNRPSPNNPDDPFYGAGVAGMGLMGIVVSATFQCIPHFNITGTQTTTTTDNCSIDLFGAGSSSKPSFETFLQQTEYTRLIWWPQENVKKMVVWQAKRIPVAPGFVPNPYQEIPYIMGSAIPATIGADLLFTAMGRWPTWLLNMMGDTPEYRAIRDAVDLGFYPLILPFICKIFVAISDPVPFQDYWYTGIPMDNQMSDRLMPVWFTELWIPIDQTQTVMNELQTFYNASTENTGSFCCEIYAAKSSPFWLSASYNTDVIRIDVFWFGNNEGSPAESFYPKFWNLLAKYNFRPHWGKFLPEGNSAQGVSYLKSLYPKWEQWMQLRQQMDPGQVFLNDYWRSHLGISSPA